MSDDLNETVDRLLMEIRQKDQQLRTIRLEVNRANRDYERLSVVGAICNMRKALVEAEEEVRKLNKELERLICR